MKNNIFVKNYKSKLDLYETQLAIKIVKDTFQKKLSEELGLIRVTAPLFVAPETGLNDNLNGYEKAVSFVVQENKETLEVVQSLAKWKRNALKKYNCTGLYTDMNAIRPFEDTDNLHSLYVDQWDWEKVITRETRNEEYLKLIVTKIYETLCYTNDKVASLYPVLKQDLPKNITFVTTEELEDKYPTLSRKERENAIAKEYGAVFLMHIGDKLKDGEPHDGRAADYDDWHLNGDIILWNKVLNIAYEISSMGIRVDEESIVRQCKAKGEEYKLQMPYHQAIINKELPLTLGGGIGQSRLCMFFLQKAHIGEVQASYWPKEDVEEFAKYNIHLL